ncbi:hypothetical protein [Pseudogracilibacillus auburnensis]|uniref:hypothetical protein n=1 Tax=Pseudogracilibacillus auburnensis TaxID=1494959 RepID=UPI001A973F60|nr:hypothetical protein [Pseudogracilibacillus auburnensis]MBO1005759.1 hypothetical protein [Pseudogracilibacillus auburnensis]
MNIAKHKEILLLRSEVRSLEEDYKSKQQEVFDSRTSFLLDQATERIKVYLEEEDFEVVFDEDLSFSANLGEINIRLIRNPRIFTVSMPNNERYSVSTESDISFLNDSYKGNNQDDEIVHLKNQIESLNGFISDIENQDIYYVLSTELYSFFKKDVEYKSKKYLDFDSIIEVMFS